MKISNKQEILIRFSLIIGIFLISLLIESSHMYDFVIINSFFNNGHSYSDNPSYFYFPSFNLFQILYWNRVVYFGIFAGLLLCCIILLRKISIDSVEKEILFITLAITACLDLYRGNNNLLLIFFSLFLFNFIQEILNKANKGPIQSDLNENLQISGEKSLKTIQHLNPSKILLIGLILACSFYKINYLIFLGVFILFLFNQFRKRDVILIILVVIITFLLLNYSLLFNPQISTAYSNNIVNQPLGWRLNILFQTNQLSWMYFSFILLCKIFSPKISKTIKYVLQGLFFLIFFMIKLMGIYLINN